MTEVEINMSVLLFGCVCAELKWMCGRPKYLENSCGCWVPMSLKSCPRKMMMPRAAMRSANLVFLLVCRSSGELKTAGFGTNLRGDDCDLILEVIEVEEIRLGLVGKGDRGHWTRTGSVAANNRIDASVLWLCSLAE